MGWCGATEMFDTVVELFLEHKSYDDTSKKEAIKRVAECLRKMDWDCETDSDYWKHPIVQEVFKELDPEMFEDEG